MDKTRNIAIIGSGISGLTAAWALKREGYSQVVVFEKENDVGGKIHSIVIQDRVCELGALVASHHFPRVMTMARALGEKLTKADHTYVLEAKGRILNYRQFITKHIGWSSFLRATARFLKEASLDGERQATGFLNAHKESFYAMSNYASAKHLSAAAKVIQPFLIGCGYGYYEKVPAMYLMKLAPSVLAQPFEDCVSFGHSQGWSTFDRGWQQLLRRLARGLDVRLATPVVSVRRNSKEDRGGVVITAGTRTEVFDDLIVTTLPEATCAFLDLSEEEARLFQRILYIRYVVTLVEGTHLVSAHFLPHIHPETMGHINCLIRKHQDLPLFQIYQMLPERMSLEEALDIAHKDVSLMGGAITRVLMQKEWRYFPHVTTCDLEQGFYRDLEGLQGKNHTHYLGSLLNFETVEHNASYAEHLIKRFFCGDCHL